MKKFFLAAIFAMGGITTADAAEKWVYRGSYVQQLPPAFFYPINPIPLKSRVKVKYREYYSGTTALPWVEWVEDCPHCHRERNQD